jgi:diguanylate cyclase (GGDEF)-like protein
VRSILPVSLLLIAAIALAVAPSARGGEPIVIERLATNEAPPDADAPLGWLGAPERRWTAAAEPGLIRVRDATWWRVRLPPSPGTDDLNAALVLRDVFDARLTAWVGDDPRPRRLDRFDRALSQPGSREHLVIAFEPGQRPEVVHLRIDFARRVPVGIAVEPLGPFLERDLGRVRFHTFAHAALLLFGFVAAIYALALRQHYMLLLSGWCLGATVYLLVMSGELYAVPGAEPLLPYAMRIASLAVNGATILAYAFMLRFLSLDGNHPTIARVIRVLLALTVPLLLWHATAVGSFAASQSINLVLLLLMVATTIGAIQRIRAGDENGWFYLATWAPVQLVMGARLVQFLGQHPTPPWLDWAFPAALAGASLILVLATARAARLAEIDLRVARERARTDPLTGLPNRAMLDASLARPVDTAAGRLCVLFVDLDHFKSINDRHGHDSGDQCLVAVAEILRRQAGADGLVARYGGEEFVVVFRGAACADAAARAEAIRNAIAETRLRLGPATVSLSASIGVASARPGESPTEVMRRADMALYRAKHEGRNRVVVDIGDDRPPLPVSEAPAPP